MCIICNGFDYKNTVWGGYHFQGKRYSIVKCLSCGFMFLNPLPSQNVLNGIYNGNDYFESYYASPTGIKGYTEGMEEYSIYDERIITLIKKYKKSGRLLDLGCAGGRFLKNAKSSGYEVFGVEPNKKMAEYAKDNLGLNVICGALKDINKEYNFFDIIHAGDVLEHLLELQKCIGKIKSLLADNGILVIEQPLMYNRSLSNLFLKINMLFKKNRYAANPPTHLWEFNSVTLKVFLEKMGFEILYCRISESVAKPLTVYKKPTIKNIFGHYIKNISSIISNSPVLKCFNMGDRAIVVCRKANNIL